jgi:hypothetical protein
VNVNLGYADETVNFGFELDLEVFNGQLADGYTIGFWKNNIAKALMNKNKGIQVDRATLENYVDEIAAFALEPFDGIDLQGALDVLSARGSDEVLLLKKQLLGSEFNFMNEAFIGDNQMLTYLFLYYGEYMVKHADEYSRDEILNLKDWFDAYNNSHGGEVIGPAN